MCGIAGGISKRNITPVVMEALKRQSYRGYDSSGIALVTGEGKLERVRRTGKFAELETALAEHPLSGTIGIAHTRWATHGGVTEENAHPHISDDIAIVHNGIIENYVELRSELEKEGYLFVSETDSEVIAHLIHFLRRLNDLPTAVHKARQQLRGSYAIGVISSKEPDTLIAVRSGSPLVIGLGAGENFIASDCSALLSVTRRFVFLEEGDIAEIKKDHYSIRAADGHLVGRSVVESALSPDDVGKGEFRHFMQKEIFEQPDAVRRTLHGRTKGDKVLAKAFGRNAPSVLRKIKAVQIVACGTSFYAGLTARYWMEPLADMPCHVDVASEWRYQKPRLHKDTLYVFISQSGETADTLACLRMVKELEPRAKTLAICNVAESSLTREADLVFMTNAGAEIGVASTKAFTTQLVSLMLLTLVLGRTHGLTKKEEMDIVSELLSLPEKIGEALLLDGELRKLAAQFIGKEHVLYLGRGVQYPVALEGSLKLKEISYIHAEGYQAGELKHGPLALVDENMPVIAVAPNDSLAEKLQSNLKEVRARNGKLFIFAPADTKIARDNDTVIVTIPSVHELLSPIVYVVPLQIFAYHVAVLRGNDVDQPRNLAKSVTVE